MNDNQLSKLLDAIAGSKPKFSWWPAWMAGWLFYVGFAEPFMSPAMVDLNFAQSVWILIGSVALWPMLLGRFISLP